jgi:hypothetical protein
MKKNSKSKILLYFFMTMQISLHPHPHASHEKHFEVVTVLYRNRDVHGGAVAAGFGKNRRGSGAVAVGFGENHRGSGAVAVAFFSRTSKNCMNLVEFQCLQMKHPETE